MATALTTGSTIACPHGGTVSPSSSAKLSVSGQPVLLVNQVTSWSISPSCSVLTNPQAGTKQCQNAVSESGGDATKLTVGGTAVLLDAAQVQTDGMPPAPPAGPIMILTAGQAKLQAV
jgi:hypothetical protein